MSLDHIVAPKMNINGTSLETLLEEYKSAYAAIENAIDVCQKITVHGRDFQTAPIGDYEIARTQHLIRLKALTQVKDEIETIILNLFEQKHS